MNKSMMITLWLAASPWIAAQTNESADCNCPSCQAKAEGRFTLPALDGLNAGHDPAGEACPPAHAHDEHEGHDHSAEEQTAMPASHDDPDGHAAHAHEEEAGVEISPEIAKKIGLQIRSAEGGTISKPVVFPAEIKLNRDRSAAVSPRYASVVRQVFAEIGDAVKKSDVLASLENRETMAVYTVSAPFDGTVIAKNLAVGESAGEEKVLFEVADLSTVWADISIFPQYQHLVRKGMPVDFVAHDGHSTRGTVQYISPLVSHETRTFTARSVLEGADEDFTPGAFVRARIATETKQVPVRVEREAVLSIAGESVVFIHDEHGFEPRDVITGLADDQAVEILSGLEPGESYVAVGAFALKAELLTRGMDPHAGHGH